LAWQVRLKAWLTAVGRAAVAVPGTAPDVVTDLLDAVADQAGAIHKCVEWVIGKSG